MLCWPVISNSFCRSKREQTQLAYLPLYSHKKINSIIFVAAAADCFFLAFCVYFNWLIESASSTCFFCSTKNNSTRFGYFYARSEIISLSVFEMEIEEKIQPYF